MINKKNIIQFIFIVIILSFLAWNIKPIRYSIIGMGYKVGIFKCPTGILDRMPRIDGPPINHDLDEVIKNNCKDTKFVF